MNKEENKLINKLLKMIKEIPTNLIENIFLLHLSNCDYQDLSLRDRLQAHVWTIIHDLKKIQEKKK